MISGISAIPTASVSVVGALVGLSLSMFQSALGTSIANVGLPTLAQTFAASFQAVQWVVLAYLLAITALIVGAGSLGDLIGRRRTLVIGLIAFTTASLLCGFASSLWQLIAARALQGIGGAAMMAMTMAFVGDAVPKEKTGRAMGLLGSMSAIGTALGPPLGGFLISFWGWRALFLANIPLGMVAAILALRFLPPDRNHVPAGGAGFDRAGMLLLMVALIAFTLAMTTGRGHFGLNNGILLLGAAAATRLFVHVESRVEKPLICLTLVRDRTLQAGLLTNALVSTVMMTTLVVGPFYLAVGLGLKAAMVGLFLSIGPLVAAVTGMPAGRLADRLGVRRVTAIGLIGIAVGSAALAALPAPLGVVAYVVPIGVITGSYALFQTANNVAVMKDVAPGNRGVVSGMLNLSRNLGLVSGASAMGAVFAFTSRATDLAKAEPAAVATGMRSTFAVAAILVTVALVVALRGRVDESRHILRTETSV